MEPSTSSSTNALLQGSSKQDGHVLPISICFTMLTTEEELATAKENAKSLNTVKSTNWTVNTCMAVMNCSQKKVCSLLDCPPHLYTLVMENMEMSVGDLITKHKGVTQLPVKLSVLNDTSKGLAHLHVNGIVHRDLNAGNVLLTASLRAKVADLGISRVIDRVRTAALTRVPGAADFMPPEALNDKPEYGPKLESFSFGHLGLYLVNEVCGFTCMYQYMHVYS